MPILIYSPHGYPMVVASEALRISFVKGLLDYINLIKKKSFVWRLWNIFIVNKKVKGLEFLTKEIFS